MFGDQDLFKAIMIISFFSFCLILRLDIIFKPFCEKDIFDVDGCI